MSFTAIMEGGPLHGEIRELDDKKLRVVIRTQPGTLEREYSLGTWEQDGVHSRVVDDRVCEVMLYRGNDGFLWKTIRQLQDMMDECDRSDSLEAGIYYSLEDARGHILDLVTEGPEGK